jgi:oligopeptide/dipeptide ABC transporter ATP-binding protein
VPPLIDVRRLTVEFPAPGSQVPGVAVRDVSFSISRGEVLGLVGESGSGKSVTCLALMRLLSPQASTRGEVLFSDSARPAASLGSSNLLEISEERMRRLRGLRIAMIFQEPMTALNPVMRVGEQIAEAVLAHKVISKKDAWNQAVEALQDVGIAEAEQRARSYPHQLSGGMRQRVVIAIAIANRPQLLIADEPTTALDVTIQAQILELLADLRRKFGLTMLFISHDLAVVSEIADRVAVMYAGSVVEYGSSRDIFRGATHPYTRGLLRSVPTLQTPIKVPLQTIAGTVPSIRSMPPGCPFEPRCDLRIEKCREAMPPFVEVSPGHWARCPVAGL